jgi:protein CpxP
MSLKRKFFSIVTLAFAVVAFSTFASAQKEGGNQTDDSTVREGKFSKRGFGKGMRGDKGMHGGKGILRILRGIELTEAQKTQIKSLMDTQRATFEPQREEMRNLMMKKRDGSINEAEQSRLTEMRNQMKASSEQLKISVMALLTAEQTAKLTQLEAERQQRRQERKQRWQEKRQQNEKPADN